VHDTIGEDLVNHCVNDILVQGAKPLFFMDYLATGVLAPDVAEQIVAGISRACVANGCALLGGETAEMPGFYAAGEYDVAGFIVGLVSRRAVVDGRQIVAGDQLVALPSSGLHTNGYSLARRIAFDVLRLDVGSHVDDLGGTVGEVLLRPHRSYLTVIEPHLERGRIKGMAHITGGGITENLPRVLPDGLRFSIDRRSWSVPPVFSWLQRSGSVPDAEMFRAFNMGVGMILVCAADDTDALLADLKATGEAAWHLGAIVDGQP
jgi:phosphoribosylformylglycinamidine cyclo-ligase